jgi:uracil-DNA glycosylase family 4
MKSFNELEAEIMHCHHCKRLVHWREKIAKEKVKRFSDWDYWGKPVPGFGDRNAELLIIGLAPAAHGGNRTGRMFTGDRSGDWLYRALFKAGFANQPTSISRNDGLILKKCFISASCRCAPPNNKPTSEELKRCRKFLLSEMQLLRHLKVIVGLGKIGFDTALSCAQELQLIQLERQPKFGHGVLVSNGNSFHILGSYHPSQQNTFTKRLREPMFDSIFTTANHLIRNSL